MNHPFQVKIRFTLVVSELLTETTIYSPQTASDPNSTDDTISLKSLLLQQ